MNLSKLPSDELQERQRNAMERQFQQRKEHEAAKLALAEERGDEERRKARALHQQLELEQKRSQELQAQVERLQLTVAEYRQQCGDSFGAAPSPAPVPASSAHHSYGCVAYRILCVRAGEKLTPEDATMLGDMMLANDAAARAAFARDAKHSVSAALWVWTTPCSPLPAPLFAAK